MTNRWQGQGFFANLLVHNHRLVELTQKVICGSCSPSFDSFGSDTIISLEICMVVGPLFWSGCIVLTKSIMVELSGKTFEFTLVEVSFHELGFKFSLLVHSETLAIGKPRYDRFVPIVLSVLKELKKLGRE